MKHTKWTLQVLESEHNGYKGWKTFAIRAENNVCLAVVGEVDRFYEKEYRSIATLMAAAPDLLKLAEMYLSDVEGRIKSIKHDRDNNECARHDPDIYDDYQQQIVHWATTAHHVEQVINQAGY